MPQNVVVRHMQAICPDLVPLLAGFDASEQLIDARVPSPRTGEPSQDEVADLAAQRDGV